MINGFIDFRSDTVTIPTPEMREAMAAADVGDDVFGDDPTVNRLQDMAAERLGLEAGLFVPSGTMGNLVALITHCQRADEAIVGDRAHSYLYEQGGMAALGGINPRPLPTQADGTLRVDDIIAAIRPDDSHFPVTRLIVLENTHNSMGGVPLTVEYTQQVADLARSRGIRLHIDGARVFNAAAALGVPVHRLTAQADSVTFCLSKGLSAPVGSVLCGSKDFIKQAHRRRKILGGGMRQAGVIAAAGIVALERMADRLPDDHANAKLLAEGIAGIPGLRINPGNVHTNLVFFEVLPDVPIDGPELCRRLHADGVRMLAVGARRCRAVTHAWVTRDEVRSTLQVLERVMTGPAAGQASATGRVTY